jgi:hypothetical protein
MLSFLTLGGRCKNFTERDPAICRRSRFLLPSLLYLYEGRVLLGLILLYLYGKTTIWSLRGSRANVVAARQSVARIW